MVFEDGYSTLKRFIDESSNIVFFGGAGVSTESGIPDFRSTDGLYNQSYDYPPETILSRSFFRQNPEEFFRFYREKMLFLDAKPNNAIELHGSVHRNHCMKCGKFYTAEAILHSKGIPRCTCGGIIKPDVVLYEESLDEGIISKAIDYISHADMLIIGGTSLVVYPAAGMVDYFEGEHLVVINKSVTHRDANAELVLKGSIGEVLSRVC